MKMSLGAGLLMASYLASAPVHAQNIDPGPGLGPWASFSIAPMGAEMGLTSMPTGFSNVDPRQACGKAVGCIVIVNENNANWDLVGYYLDTRLGQKPSKPRWVNQISSPLRPHRWGAIYRIGDNLTKAVPLKIVWRNRNTGETLEDFGTVDLFDSGDRASWLQHVKVVIPEVSLEPPPASAEPSATP